MKTTLLLCASAFASLTLVSCVAPPPDDFQDTTVRETRVIHHYDPPAPRQESPEDFRAITPPSSYSR